ncbi:hypothetical protein LPTSP4_01460 [Leptospira ryugenii]|uniref:DUF2147 domain-containing protein n=1 Tax=Leptospira ryugenii TaxID=1917863 RepID=A0A2P2DVH4_9LEPT|nr:DUF2147 domain-containing protein [Leptospira ryugenii]GBF48646.1 hypothetical protein LPTSP4_01460 [Leptospira ryugenii]
MIKTIVIIFILHSNSLFAQDGNLLFGNYFPPEKDRVIELYPCEGKICGRTICIRDNFYKENEDGLPGTPLLDSKNENPSLRSRKKLGIVFIENFESVGRGIFRNGTIYNPRDGKTYCGKMTLTNEGKQLELRGNLCMLPFIGKTNTWQKIDKLSLDENRWECLKR